MAAADFAQGDLGTMLDAAKLVIAVPAHFPLDCQLNIWTSGDGGIASIRFLLPMCKNWNKISDGVMAGGGVGATQ